MKTKVFTVPAMVAVLVSNQIPSEAASDIEDLSYAKLSEGKGELYKRGFADQNREVWSEPERARVGDKVYEGMQLGTGDNSWAQLTWRYITTRAWANSVYAIAPNQKLVYLIGGEMLFQLDKNRKDKSEYQVWTNLLQARIRGTTVMVQVTGGTSRVSVLEGSVDVINRSDHSIVHIKPGVVYEVKAKDAVGAAPSGGGVEAVMGKSYLSSSSGVQAGSPSAMSRAGGASVSGSNVSTNNTTASVSTTSSPSTAGAAAGISGGALNSVSGLATGTLGKVIGLTGSGGLLGGLLGSGSPRGLLGGLLGSGSSGGLLGGLLGSGSSGGLLGGLLGSGSSGGLLGGLLGSGSSGGLLGGLTGSGSTGGLLGGLTGSGSTSGLLGGLTSSGSKSGVLGGLTSSGSKSGVLGGLTSSGSKSGVLGGLTSSGSTSGLLGGTSSGSTSGLLGGTSSGSTSGLLGGTSSGSTSSLLGGTNSVLDGLSASGSPLSMTGHISSTNSMEGGTSLVGPGYRATPLFETSKTITTLYAADPNGIAASPLLTQFEGELPSASLVSNSLSNLPPPDKAVSSASEIVRVPVLMSYNIGSSVGSSLPLPAGSVSNWPPTALIGSGANVSAPGNSATQVISESRNAAGKLLSGANSINPENPQQLPVSDVVMGPQLATGSTVSAAVSTTDNSIERAIGTGNVALLGNLGFRSGTGIGSSLTVPGTSPTGTPPVTLPPAPPLPPTTIPPVTLPPLPPVPPVTLPPVPPIILPPLPPVHLPPVPPITLPPVPPVHLPPVPPITLPPVTLPPITLPPVTLPPLVTTTPTIKVITPNLPAGLHLGGPMGGLGLPGRGR